jgi:hypothetical protein
MIIIRVLYGIFSVTAAILAGNWAGSQLRSILTGLPVHSFQSVYKTSRGVTIRNIPVVTKFYPALLFVLIGKPRCLFAFIGGFLTGSLFDDRFENAILEQIDQRIFAKTNLAKAQAENEPG